MNESSGFCPDLLSTFKQHSIWFKLIQLVETTSARQAKVAMIAHIAKLLASLVQL